MGKLRPKPRQMMNEYRATYIRRLALFMASE
jgi:hypothetical protein